MSQVVDCCLFRARPGGPEVTRARPPKSSVITAWLTVDDKSAAARCWLPPTPR